METRKEKAVRLFHEGYNCAQAVFATYSDLYQIDQETALRLSASFGGGMGRMREVCGAVSGMFLLAGLETGATDGKDIQGKKKNYDLVQQMAKEYKDRNGSIVCKDLLGLSPEKESGNYTDTTPEQRSAQYYKKRPCADLVADAADIIEQMLGSFEEQDKQIKLDCDQIVFSPVVSEDHIFTLAKIADEVWHQYFAALLSLEQIDYMVNKFQSFEAIQEQIKHQSYQYYLIQKDGINLGYIGIKPDGERLFLSKVYLLKKYRGRGCGTKIFEFLEDICSKNCYKAIWLTVNRYNETALNIYKYKGFRILYPQIIDIGNGFVMDDFVMEKAIILK